MLNAGRLVGKAKILEGLVPGRQPNTSWSGWAWKAASICRRYASSCVSKVVSSLARLKASRRLALIVAGLVGKSVAAAKSARRSARLSGRLSLWEREDGGGLEVKLSRGASNAPLAFAPPPAPSIRH
jgi:hypothetical protein